MNDIANFSSMCGMGCSRNWSQEQHKHLTTYLINLLEFLHNLAVVDRVIAVPSVTFTVVVKVEVLLNVLVWGHICTRVLSTQLTRPLEEYNEDVYIYTCQNSKWLQDCHKKLLTFILAKFILRSFHH